nr:hypothetical protein [Tanacetum cinerariifolium]
MLGLLSRMVWLKGEIGKFEAKGDEGYFLGYSMSSKAFRVHEEHLESTSSQPQDACKTDAPESSRNSNPTTTSTNPSANQLETLIGETPIPTVLKNKKDERGIVVRNKASLVAQGHIQEEGIDYDELCREFKALMHEKFQMSVMGELNFFLGLQVLQKEDGSFLSQDKYVGDILKKFRYSDVKSSNTPTDKENPWGKNGTGKDVDIHLYRSMIRYLMYLTASRPDIMFAVYACVQHQVTPKECHLNAVKRIFRYLKGHHKLGLWYPKVSPFDLVAYSDSEYGGAT